MRHIPFPSMVFSAVMLFFSPCLAQKSGPKLPADFDNLVFEENRTKLERIYFENGKGYYANHYYAFYPSKRNTVPPERDTLSLSPDGSWNGRFVTVEPGASDLVVTYKGGLEKGKTKYFGQLTGKQLTRFDKIVNSYFWQTWRIKAGEPENYAMFVQLTKEQQMETEKDWKALKKKTKKLNRKDFRDALDSFLAKHNYK